ncbi:MAG TPA: glycoside hydrolase family 3 N-terminal domain-containing protein [Rhodocyclaceae bacterium]|nr:glycoside hydrolase family 3 N-terminal domain-containing protein [Rhodocyclaceae bacterium]
MINYSGFLRPPLWLLILLAALALLYWAWHLKHPLMMALRPVETPLLLGAGCLGLIHGWRLAIGSQSRRRGIVQSLLFAALMLTTIAQEARFQWQRARVLEAAPLLRVLGGHFLIGFSDYDSLAPLAERGLIGGIYLTRRNVAGRSLAEVRAEIDRLPPLRKAQGLPPLFVAADQEGGRVNHLSPLLPARPALAQFAALKPAQRAAAAHAYGRQQGADLAAIGVNLNLGPVVDLKPARHGLWLDTHTLTHQRAISGNAEIVRQIATTYIAGLQASGVQATLKHFPGLGPVQGDTHHRAARLNLPRPRLAREWAPFEQISRQTGSAIMVSHVHLDAIDAQQAASRSRAVIEGTIRQQWNHQGLVLTDDLNMGAVYRDGIGRVAAASLNAGADLILVTYDHDQFYRALYDATQAYRHGAIDERLLIASRQRLLAHWSRQSQSPP